MSTPANLPAAEPRHKRLIEVMRQHTTLCAIQMGQWSEKVDELDTFIDRLLERCAKLEDENKKLRERVVELEARNA